jgi:hypothetical protein
MNDPRLGQTSASSAQADALCPGRHLAQRGIAEPARSKDSEWGDQIHAALKMVPNPPSLDALEALAEYQSLEPRQQEIAESCLSIELAKVVDFFGPDDLEKAKATCQREKRFWVKLTDAIGHSGQADVVYRVGNRALIVDYKSLAAEKPESAENLQLRDLVCLVAGHYIVVNQVGCVIVQPLATHSPTPCLYEKEDIQRATQEMFRRVMESNNPESKRVPGEDQCQFCRAKLNCPAHAQFAGYAVPSNMPPDLWRTAIADWSPQQRVAFCEKKAIASKWLDEIWDYMREGVKKDPSFIPGYGLSPNSPMSPVNDPQELFNRLVVRAKESNPAVESDDVLMDFMRCVKTTKKDVEHLVSKLTGLKGKKLAEECKRLFDGITSEIPKADSLKKL